MRRLSLASLLLIPALLVPLPAHAETKVLTAEGNRS